MKKNRVNQLEVPNFMSYTVTKCGTAERTHKSVQQKVQKWINMYMDNCFFYKEVIIYNEERVVSSINGTGKNNHMQKNETGPLSCIIYKHQFKMN